ncbi:MAG: serine/threonine-protein kinase [Polyangiaceae bacterium]
MLDLIAPGHVICDRYRVVRALGKGGMGVVLEAEDTALKRLVALKVTRIRNGLFDDDTDPQREERFLREASLSAQIHHPNVVTVFDYGRGEHGVETFCYIAMQLLKGETLGARLRSHPGGLPVGEALAFVTQVARGLRAAHQKGLVHRDLKPDNIMLMPGEDGEEIACILDFGLAKNTSIEQNQEITDAGTVMGTPEYMSPEQVQAMEVDARSDLYSLGIVLYECLTGLPPFLEDNAFRIAAAHLRQKPPPMRVPAGRPPFSNELSSLVMSLLDKRRDTRLQSAEVLLRRLRDLPESRSRAGLAAPEVLSLATKSNYQTGRKLATSPRAHVYDATHMELGRQVAVKVYRTLQPAHVARLRRELPSLAVLRHPSNVRVLDTGSFASKGMEQPFLVMERVRGVPLSTVLAKTGAFAWQRAVALGAAILDGLAEAHAVGMLHRQLTPEHVLVTQQETRRESVKIISYRIADADTEGSGPILPSLPDPRYVAPEIMRGGAPNERSDLFGAAVILHEMLLGRAPDDPRGQGGRPVPSVPHLPVEVIEILRRALAIDPRERFDSAGDMAAALLDARAAAESLGDGSPTSARRELRATGLPVIWCLTGDPALRRPCVIEALDSLRGAARVEELSADQRSSLATSLAAGDTPPPWVVVFGGMHVILEDPLLAALSTEPEVSRIMVSTHQNAEILEGAINYAGLDQHITLPSNATLVREALTRMVSRSAAARRFCDDLRHPRARSSSSFLPAEPLSSSLAHPLRGA